jgi:uncharacterized membrane protein YeaQ/YmgE (transglycosylase-associated protein family)
MGWVMTCVLGVLGSFIGGLLASVIAGTNVLHLRSSGIIGSVLGAIILLAVGFGSKSRRP